MEEGCMMKRRSAILGLGVEVGCIGAFRCAPAAATEAASAPPYSGDFLTRSTLSGDWGGSRNELAAKGVTFESSITQITQGVVDGGKNGAWEYGGRGDLTGTLDTGK